ncbi:hypothetical protein RCH16_001763 [Cryobacterium sp. MP_M5]|uniref:hypothetical protein n=1 Tax=unclassified Cryobacterium TaxID=2649013 RepID=UPI0018C91AF0|nr:MULTISPECIES: hypothetical protein [unclassified Cryobacterium]MBG6058766.1 hypothetical protein [Cryobacterium sp. MP_M3]MEC5176755.1 hypothetical protein [Cryobacterium sp. MP_M5]
MLNSSGQETGYVVAALLFQMLLVAHFALRRWRFDVAVRYGWIVYALGIPAAALSVLLLAGGAPRWQWTGGFLYLAWAAFGFVVEYVRQIEWRSPVRWPVFVPYLALYLATSMFYWWPLARVGLWAWLAGAVLFVAATVLNVTSHRAPDGRTPPTP